MLFYALIGLSFVLLGVAGLQFTYMFYLERIHAERRKHISVLERQCRDLTTKLEDARIKLDEQQGLIEKAYPELRANDEVWAEVIEDR